MRRYPRARDDQIQTALDAAGPDVRLGAERLEFARNPPDALRIAAVVGKDPIDVTAEPLGEIARCGCSATRQAQDADSSEASPHQRLADSTKYSAKPAPAMMPVTIQNRSMICVSDHPFIS